MLAVMKHQKPVNMVPVYVTEGTQDQKTVLFVWVVMPAPILLLMVANCALEEHTVTQVVPTDASHVQLHRQH